MHRNDMNGFLSLLLFILSTKLQMAQCIQGTFSIRNIQYAIDDHLFRNKSNRNTINYFYPRPFIYSSRGGDDGSSHDNGEEVEKAILAEIDLTDEEADETNEICESTISSSMLPLEPPSPHLAKKHFHDQIGESNDESSSSLTPDNWISSFQSQIQAIREDMEREAALELEHVKQEILEIREEKKRKLDEELELKAKQEMERLLNEENKRDSIVDEDNEYWQEVTNRLIEEVDEDMDLDKSSFIDNLQQDITVITTNDEIEFDSDQLKKDRDDEILIIGDTDENEDEVIERLSSELKGTESKPRQSMKLEKTSRTGGDLKKSIKKEKIEECKDESISLKPQKERKQIKKRSKKAKQKSKVVKKLSGLSQHTDSPSSLSNNLQVTNEYTHKQVKDEISVTLGRKIVGHSVQAILFLIIFGLVAHVLFAEGGGIGFLLKGLFMPSSTVSN